MNKFRFTINAVAIAIFTFAVASMAHAQATRTWVSGVGDDANPCSRTAPCKTFAGAISKTANNGEIDALDPGGFGVVTITKSILIDGGGGQVASVLSSGSPGAIVVAAQPGDTVTLMNLRINGDGTTFGVNGIRFLSGKALNVLNCYIYNFSNNGIDISQNQTATVFVKDTTVKHCNADGLASTTSSGFVSVAIERSSFLECNNGVHIKSGSKATARNCDFSLNGSNGVFADAAGSVFAQISVWASVISHNGGNGVASGNGGNAGSSGVEISQNQIIFNTSAGVFIGGGGNVSTFTNNEIVSNGSNGCPGCTNAAPGN